MYSANVHHSAWPGSHLPQLTGSDGQIHGCTRIVRLASRANASGLNPAWARTISASATAARSVDGVTYRVVQVVGRERFEQHPDGGIRRFDVGNRVRVGGHAENGDGGRYRLSVSETCRPSMCGIERWVSTKSNGSGRT